MAEKSRDLLKYSSIALLDSSVSLLVRRSLECSASDS